MNDFVPGPLHHESVCECAKDACSYIEVTDSIRWGLSHTDRYVWWVALKSGDHLVDLKKAREFINKAIGELEAKKFHGVLTPRSDPFF